MSLPSWRAVLSDGAGVVRFRLLLVERLAAVGEPPAKSGSVGPTVRLGRQERPDTYPPSMGGLGRTGGDFA